MKNAIVDIKTLLAEDENSPTCQVDMYSRITAMVEALPPFECVTLKMGVYRFEGTPQVIGMVIFAHLNSEEWADEVTLKYKGKEYTFTTDPACPLSIW